MLAQASKLRWSAKNVAIILFIVGLLLRVLMIPMHTSTDLAGHVKWGKNTYEQGLATAFQGAYFPIQYLISSGAYLLSDGTTEHAVLIIKAFNLIAELGILALLAYMLRKRIALWKLMLLYWLNPITLIFFEQGYVESQIVLFILLSIFVVTAQISRYPYILAGIPLGISLLMKPEAVPISIGIGLLAIMCAIRKEYRDLKILGIFIFPAIFFIGFSAYFGFTLDFKGHNSLPIISTVLQQKAALPAAFSDFVAKSAWLAVEYKYVPDNMPALNAYMPNAWFFVAEPMRPPNVNIYRVSDKLKLFGVTYRSWSLLIFLAVFALLILKIMRREQPLEWKMAWVMMLAPALLAYLVTGAHENHFYYGFVTMLLMGVLIADKKTIYSVYLLGILNGLNVLYLFILPHYMDLSLNLLYPTVARAFVAGASSIIFFAMLYHLLHKADIAPAEQLS